MKQQHVEIIELISEFLKKYPNQRFGQALFNLAVNEFKNDAENEFQLRDIYNDSDDEILMRIKKQIETHFNELKN
ncbi:hypothetical protein [Soonwooa purpurea]